MVLVKHHSPQLAQPQLLAKVVLMVWHMTGSGSIPALKTLEINCVAFVNILLRVVWFLHDVIRYTKYKSR